MNQVYLDTARLLTQVAPFVFTDGTFALKGGTAINLFVRDMPRLSVDLDLVFTDHQPSRDQALQRINAAIQQSAVQLSNRGFQTHAIAASDAGETKLLVRRGGLEVKIEVNFVMRGTVHPVRIASLTDKARDTLVADLDLPIVSLEDMYGGKLVAAMDRQHPRDIFDVMQLFAHEGITAGIRRAFVVYLSCHNRPVHEVLFASLRDVRQDYDHNFNGMTTEPVALADLLAARDRMVRELREGLDADERRFLLSLSSPANRNGPCCGWRICSTSPASDGSCKICDGSSKRTPKSLPSNPARSRGCCSNIKEGCPALHRCRTRDTIPTDILSAAITFFDRPAKAPQRVTQR